MSDTVSLEPLGFYLMLVVLSSAIISHLLIFIIRTLYHAFQWQDKWMGWFFYALEKTQTWKQKEKRLQRSNWTIFNHSDIIRLVKGGGGGV